MSNLGGPFGIKQFCAIVNPPQSGILAIGSGKCTLLKCFFVGKSTRHIYLNYFHGNYFTRP